jgi:hypothetical protein
VHLLAFRPTRVRHDPSLVPAIKGRSRCGLALRLSASRVAGWTPVSKAAKTGFSSGDVQQKLVNTPVTTTRCTPLSRSVSSRPVWMNASYVSLSWTRMSWASCGATRCGRRSQASEERWTEWSGPQKRTNWEGSAPLSCAGVCPCCV